jgi:hypothetical protein
MHFWSTWSDDAEPYLYLLGMVEGRERPCTRAQRPSLKHQETYKWH